MGYQQQNMAQSIGWFHLFGLCFLVILLGIVDILPMLVKKKWYFPWIYQIFFVYLYSKLRFWLRIALRTIKEFAGEGLRETRYTSSVEKLGQFQPSALHISHRRWNDTTDIFSKRAIYISPISGDVISPQSNYQRFTSLLPFRGVFLCLTFCHLFTNVNTPNAKITKSELGTSNNTTTTYIHIQNIAKIK
jgi:hypothetical protein